MRKIPVILLLFSVFAEVSGQSLLSSRISEQELASLLVPRTDWRPVPGPGDRAVWENLSETTKQAYVSQAEALLDYQWPFISATTTLLFVRTGDRDEYQRLSFPKRSNLGTLVIAEVIENKGRFMDQIMNGIWSICEESDWGVPAHYQLSPAGSGLPNVADPWVDLFAAETVNFLAWADYFVGAKLDSISPLIRERIRLEADKRIFIPILTRPHAWREFTFNWNTWICSNWLNAALLLIDDQDVRAKHTHMALESLDNFLDAYPADGGCDEGPGYWGAAGASLFECLEVLNLATNGQYQVFDHSLIRNIGSYIYKVQISEDYFINFADADPKMKPDGSWVYRFGKRIGDPMMMQFGAYYQVPGNHQVGTFHFTREILNLADPLSLEGTGVGLPLPGQVWFPDIQVMLARDREGSEEGFFLAAKGGNNGEAHNHNDVGNFIVYYDGLPLLIDAGRGTYTARFFGADRWSLWMTNSRHHNVPGMEGCEQPPGLEYKASAVKYHQKGRTISMEMDLQGAYPADCGIQGVKRNLSFRKGKSITVSDLFELKSSGRIYETLMTIYKPDVSEPGAVILRMPVEESIPREFRISYDSKLMEATFQRMPMDLVEDRAIVQKWGDEVYRIQLSLRKPMKVGEIQMKITTEK